MSGGDGTGGGDGGKGDSPWWFPFGFNGNGDGWRLDVVTLLAVIGESSMAEHAQAITASVLCMLPRILPAPQALLKPSRPLRMPETTAKMVGVFSGVCVDSVGFFANIIHPLDQYQPFAFQVLEIKHTNLNEAGGYTAQKEPTGSNRRISRLFRKDSDLATTLEPRSPLPKPLIGDVTQGVELQNISRNGSAARTQTQASSVAFDVESQGVTLGRTPGLRRRFTEKATDTLAYPTLANKAKRPAIPAKLWSPLHILACVSFLNSMAIISYAGYLHDGNAIIGIATISIASSIVGYASWWTPILMNRSHTNKVPRADIMIRTREGAFIYIKCSEEVARELYSGGTEECDYHVGGRTYRFLMGIGTMLLMVSVIFLGNCSWWSQVLIACSYVIQNGLYWGLGMLPKHYFWDLSRYEWRDLTEDDSRNAHLNDNPSDEREGHKSFTRTLWYAIRETKSTGWAVRSGAAPITPQWKKWLDMAEQEAIKGNRTWEAVAAKDKVMSEGIIDTAEQHAPAVEVQQPLQAQQNSSSF
jgi:hypothetical protein